MKDWKHKPIGPVPSGIASRLRNGEITFGKTGDPGTVDVFVTESEIEVMDLILTANCIPERFGGWITVKQPSGPA